MASWFTHVLVAGALGKTQHPGVRTTRFLMLSIICSVFPDVDVLGLIWGIEYGHVLGHRGVMYSLCFALILALVTVVTGFSGVLRGSKTWWLLVLHFFLVTALHGVLDAMTNGGLGVAFFAPFENSRYFFPWTPIEVSPIGAGFFGMQGLRVLSSEILYVWLPILIVANAMSLFQKPTMKSG